MAEHNYPWLLDVVDMKRVPMRGTKMTPTWYKPGAIGRWLERVDYLIYLDMDLVGKLPRHAGVLRIQCIQTVFSAF